MIPKKIIEKAIEGGWEGDNFDIYAMTVMRANGWNTDEMKRAADAVIALDPSFWQALGKSCGWAKGGYKRKWFVGPDELISRVDGLPKWRWHADRFYDLILTGGNTEKFWEEILK